MLIEFVCSGSMSASCDMIIGPFPEIICLPYVTFPVAKIADLEVNCILTIAIYVAFYIPNSSSCIKGLACLEVERTNLTIGIFTVEYAIFSAVIPSNESSIGYLA